MPVNEAHSWEWTFALGLDPEQFDHLAAILAVRQHLAVNGPSAWVNQRVLCHANAPRHQKHRCNKKDPDPDWGRFRQERSKQSSTVRGEPCRPCSSVRLPKRPEIAFPFARAW